MGRPRRSIAPAEKTPLLNGHSEKNAPSSKRPANGIQEEVPVAKKTKVNLECKKNPGILLTVGTGDVGQLGLGPDKEECTRPGVVTDVGQDIVDVAAGGLHTVCLNSKGKVFTFGCNDEGALGRVTAEEEDMFTSGEVDVPGTVVQISSGDCHSAALTSTGQLYAWGCFRDNNGLLGFMEKGNMQKTPRKLLEGETVVKIASGCHHLTALTQDGRVFTCGCGETGQLGRIAEVFATRNSRNRNGAERLLVPEAIKSYLKYKQAVIFEDVWAGGMATFARAQESGDVYTCGLNNYCQLGDLDTNMKFQPKLLNSWPDKKWKQVETGQHHSVCLDDDGQVYAMGRMEYGRLGLGENSGDALVPTPIPALKGKRVIRIAVGETVSFAVTDEGEAYGWGMGTSNQLAQGDEEDRWTPTLLGGKQLAGRKVLNIDAGGQHTIIIASP